jgi:hypothetical protein
MKLNLDSLKSEIESYLSDNNFILFRGYSRGLETGRSSDWDTTRYPDYKQFLKVAKQLDVRLIVFHHREFAAGMIDDTIDDLESQYGYDEDGSIARRLNELRAYEGFTCSIELSFEHEGTIFFFNLDAPWYEEYRDIVDELDMLDRGDGAGEEEDDDQYPGYYSKN